MRQDDEAKHFLIMSCRGDAFAIIESYETAYQMFQALKDRYDSKKTKDLVKATTKLEKCYMKSDIDDPYLWIVEMERLNREVEKCENGSRRSEEQMQATILARLPKRRYESVITSLNGKIGTKGFDNKDFIAEIIGHYEMFVEPFKNRQNRENQDQRENKERGKHLALNTTSGKGAWRTFKGKCNKCGRQGHRARDCRSNGNSNNSGEKDIEKPKVKCYSYGGFGHIARDCPKKEESGMFVGMTIHGADIREDDVKKNQEAKTEYFDTNKFEIELLQEIADYNRKKRSVLKDIREFKWKPRKYNKFQQVISQKKKVEKKTMSWADMCETSDEEEYDNVDENENRGIVDEKEIIYQMEKTSKPWSRMDVG